MRRTRLGAKRIPCQANGHDSRRPYTGSEQTHAGTTSAEPRHGREIRVVGVFAAGLGELSSTVGGIPPARPFDGLRATLHEAPVALSERISTKRLTVAAPGQVG